MIREMFKMGAVQVGDLGKKTVAAVNDPTQTFSLYTTQHRA